ncbi:hypothetical protein C483_17813 [Natrialba hulunbeirensis JCM 10989]|uniref:DUF420 domain-containing protein n=1 Tax=Natrialba hulunbeirensis JCM 10989 TaxID=1227493 RepID=L9ZRK0_9EURY|nr:hypothetical protein C483_17813 [Natrialba hulunbeirensis JCM 10989]
MATADATRERLREHPLGATIFLSIVGYALVIGTFLFELPIYPELTNAQVNLFTHAIAVINLATTVLLIAGWYWIRVDEVEKHRLAMIGAFILIILFLVVYLTRVGGGGGEKQFVGPDSVYYAYLVMLAIHIVLSIVSVPVVLYALILGLTHTLLRLSGDAGDPHRPLDRLRSGGPLRADPRAHPYTRRVAPDGTRPSRPNRSLGVDSEPRSRCRHLPAVEPHLRLRVSVDARLAVSCRIARYWVGTGLLCR